MSKNEAAIEKMKAGSASATDFAAGKLPRRKITPDEIREFDAVEVEEFTLADLPPEERERAQEIGAAVNALALKGMLNRMDPKKYPVPSDSSSIEAKAAELAKSFSPSVFERLRPRLEKAVAEPARLSRMLGRLDKVDFQKADLTADFKSLSVKPALKAPRAGEESVLRSGSTYNRLQLVLRHLRCVDETNPEGGDDDMILGGVLIGASGNVKVPKAFVAGHFDDGDLQDFGELYFGQYNINSTNGYPKSFYCIFKLVESDSDDKEVAEQLTATLSFVANVILSAFVGPLVGQTAGAVISSVGGFLSGLIDEDEFPPYGVRLTMSNNNPFGGPVSSYRRTGNIRAHGGEYRIGYRWVLGA